MAVVSVYVEWGYELYRLDVGRRSWARIMRGDAVVLRGKRYTDGTDLWIPYWHFNHDGPGRLLVTYRNRAVDEGTGFDGGIDDASIHDAVSGKEIRPEYRLPSAAAPPQSADHPVH